MKRIVIFIFTIVCLPAFSQSKKSLLLDHKEGVYLSVLDVAVRGVDSLVYRRKDGFQTESKIENGVETVLLKSKVIWISDKKYVLRSLTMINNDTKVLKDDIVCKIIEVNKEFYVVRAYQNSGGKKIKIDLKLYVYK